MGNTNVCACGLFFGNAVSLSFPCDYLSRSFVLFLFSFLHVVHMSLFLSRMFIV